MASTIVIPAHLAVRLPRRSRRHVAVIGEPSRRRRRAASSHEDTVIDLFGAGDDPVIALMPRHDENAAMLRARRVIVAADGVRITVTDDYESALWCVAIAVELARADHRAVVRALEVLCNGPQVVGEAPRRSWGPMGLEVPALRPVTLARWASGAWVPCTWCDRGGAAGYPCLRCGAPIARRPHRAGAVA